MTAAGRMIGGYVVAMAADNASPLDDHALFRDGPKWDFSDAEQGNLTRSLVLMAAALAILLVASLMVADEPDVITQLAAGVILVGVVAAAAVRALRADPPRTNHAIAILVVAAAAAVTVATTRAGIVEAVGRGAGVVLVLFGGIEMWRALRGHDNGSSRANLRSAATLMIALGAAFIVFPAVTANLGFLLSATLLSGSLMLRAAIAAGFLPLSPDRSGVSLALRWLRYNAETNRSRGSAIEEFYFEGDEAPGRFLRFSILMTFAAGIATMGVITDSTAVVIGAMLIAPLITPMMGMGLSLAMGWPRRLGHSALTTLLGIVIAIGSGAAITIVTGVTLDLTTNTQVVSRSSPTVADLIIAVIAGGAGAYANARRDVASALPGVAIAIALVPPLAVVGITAAHGAWEMSAGTLLLFVTNMVAILLVGGAVFLLTGLAPIRQVAAQQYRVRTTIIGLSFLAIMVVGALYLNGEQVATDALNHDQLASVVNEWLGEDSDFAVISLEVEDEVATIVLAGPGDPPGLEGLAESVRTELDDDRLTLDIQWIARQRTVVEPEGS